MRIETLSLQNVGKYLDYLQLALSLEPEMMTTDIVDEKEIVEALAKESSEVCKSLLAFEQDQVIGRLEYHFYTCIQDQYKMAYVNWVYVLPAYRHKGVAQYLFKTFEAICVDNQVNQYFLIRADNEEAEKFYTAFSNVKLSDMPILRKDIN
ncbi:GNAT family N-acetyltransferase [Streptococcus sp. 20-1249]|uniref:GNAT family N-acetyltransferase n=1 Tax=Streptococcus hepaticus TaxID=3349163 RepID=UPI0037494F7B